MKKCFLEDLPRHKGGKGSGRGTKKGDINWNISIGRKVKFIYNNVKGEIEIIGIVGKDEKSNVVLNIRYDDKIFKTCNSSLRNCEFGSLLGINKSRKYKYKIGDIVNRNNQRIEILDTIRYARTGDTVKGYKYKCLKDGDIDTIDEGALLHNKNICQVCANNKVVKGINDLNTTHDTIAKLFKNKEDSYKYSYGSNKEIIIKCPRCGEEKQIAINTLVKYGFSCSKCSDGKPYPEKIMFNVLQQIKIKNITGAIFDWSKNIIHNNRKLSGDKKYDFYIPLLNIVIETHGGQHYSKNGFVTLGGRNLETEQENDKLKYDLAIQNEIKQENYIVIDCRVSDLEFIKNKILNSRLVELFDLSTIDWNKAHEFACDSRVKEACELWNGGIRSTKEIGKIMELNHQTIIKYLKQGTKLKWSTYNPKEVMKENGERLSKYYSHNSIGKASKRRKQIICLNDKKVFDYFGDAEIYYNIKLHSSNFSKCCRGLRKYSGVLKNGEKLQWMYYDEYLKLQEVI